MHVLHFNVISNYFPTLAENIDTRVQYKLRGGFAQYFHWQVEASYPCLLNYPNVRYIYLFIYFQPLFIYWRALATA